MRVRYERSFFKRPVFQFPYKKLCILKIKEKYRKSKSKILGFFFKIRDFVQKLWVFKVQFVDHQWSLRNDRKY